MFVATKLIYLPKLRLAVESPCLSKLHVFHLWKMMTSLPIYLQPSGNLWTMNSYVHAMLKIETLFWQSMALFFSSFSYFMSWTLRYSSEIWFPVTWAHCWMSCTEGWLITDPALHLYDYLSSAIVSPPQSSFLKANRAQFFQSFLIGLGFQSMDHPRCPPLNLHPP